MLLYSSRKSPGISHTCLLPILPLKIQCGLSTGTSKNPLSVGIGLWLIMQGLHFERRLAVRLSNTWKYVCNGSIQAINLCLKCVIPEARRESKHRPVAMISQGGGGIIRGKNWTSILRGGGVSSWKNVDLCSIPYGGSLWPGGGGSPENPDPPPPPTGLKHYHHAPPPSQSH